MSSIIKIAVDAMGGDNSPKKIIDGVMHHYSSNQSTFYKIFGDKDKILRLLMVLHITTSLIPQPSIKYLVIKIKF